VPVEKGGQRRRAEAQGVAIDIDEHRPGAGVTHGVAGGDEGQALGDDLLLQPHPDEVQGHMQSHRAVDRRHGEACPGEGRDPRLELRHRRSHRGDEVGVDAVHQPAPLRALEHQAVQGDGAGAVEGADRGDQGGVGGRGIGCERSHHN
jgi:hypothetical protein